MVPQRAINASNKLPGAGSGMPRVVLFRVCFVLYRPVRFFFSVANGSVDRIYTLLLLRITNWSPAIGNLTQPDGDLVFGSWAR